MLSAVFAILVVVALALGPVLWRLWRDRREDRALAVRAAVDAAMRRALHGESLVAVQVKAPTALQSGRVILSVPAAWDWLVREAWTSVIEHVPHNYELVVRAGGRPLVPASPSVVTLPRAA
jgi:hypothetical protein